MESHCGINLVISNSQKEGLYFFYFVFKENNNNKIKKSKI